MLSLLARAGIGVSYRLLRLARVREVWGSTRAVCSGLDEEAHATAPNTENTLTFLIPARLKRCGMEMRLVIPAGGPTDLMARPDNALIKALTRAHEWKEQLVSGKASSIQAIANKESVSERYISRVLRLAFLAPDITEAILDGYHPPELGLDRVLRGVPLLWADQRRVFGMRSSA